MSMNGEREREGGKERKRGFVSRYGCRLQTGIHVHVLKTCKTENL